jgi:threonine dehydrogenase-like Zn-dependent dehydrogenase
MKALVYTGPKTLVVRDEPDPQANEDVIVRVHVCGICGSDMHAYLGHDERRPPPQILGHEAIGVATSGTHEGKRVAINPLVTCGDCNACRGGRPHVCRSRQIMSMMPRAGAFAELVRVPETNLNAVPDGLATEVAALSEPLAVAYHAVNLGERALHLPLAGAHIAVMGGGAIGLCVAQVLESRGAHNVLIAETSEIRRARIDIAGRFASYDPTGSRAPQAASVDLVLDAYGGKASRAEASRIVAPGGVIVHIGLGSAEGGVDVRKLTLQEIKFIGSYCYTPVEFRETLAGLASGIFGAFDWTEQRPLSEGATAFAELDAGTVAAAKIMLRM